MRQEQFTAIMPYISADLIGMISRKQSVSEEEAIKKLYASRHSANLEQEQTKVWQNRTPMQYKKFLRRNFNE